MNTLQTMMNDVEFDQAIKWDLLQRTNESYITVNIANLLSKEGYVIQSKSGNGYPNPYYDRICEKTHKGSFDLMIMHDDFQRVGVEIKPIFNITTFQEALGQTLVRLALNEADIAILFARTVEGRKTWELIRKVMGNIIGNIAVRIYEPEHRIIYPKTNLYNNKID